MSKRADRSATGPLFFPVLLVLTLVPATQAKQREDAPSPPPIKYERHLGPFPIEGHDFSVRLSVTCYKESRHEGMCNEDDEETVTSLKIVDEKEKTHFRKSFPVPFVHQLGMYLVDAVRLEGRQHEALELIYEKLPSPPRTGESIQIFGMRDGTLKPFDSEPLEFHGGIASLPAGQTSSSKRLFEGDTLNIYELTTYFYIITPIRLNWVEFRLEQQDSGEFDIASERPYQIRPEIQSERLIKVYQSPNKETAPASLNLSPQSQVRLLKARFTAAPPDEHDSANDTWLEVQIDDRKAWILGIDSYTALGLSSLNESGR